MNIGIIILLITSILVVGAFVNKKQSSPSTIPAPTDTSIPTPTTNKPVVTQTEITTTTPIDLSNNYLSQTTVFNSPLFSLRYPNTWKLKPGGDYIGIFYDPAGAQETYSHAGTIYKNSIWVTAAITSTQSVEEYMKELDAKKDASIKRSYEAWQESKAKDTKYPEYVQSAWDRPYSDKQKIVKGDVEYLIYYDSSGSAYYFIVSNRKVLIRGWGELISDKNSIERKILESITPN